MTQDGLWDLVHLCGNKRNWLWGPVIPCEIDQSKQKNHEQGHQWAMCRGDKMTLSGLVSAQIYNDPNVTLLRGNDDDSRWTVSLDSVVWKQRELIVKSDNLRVVDKVFRLSQPSIDNTRLTRWYLWCPRSYSWWEGWREGPWGREENCVHIWTTYLDTWNQE